LTYQSSLLKNDELSWLGSRHIHIISKLQGQLSDFTAAQGSLLHADAEQEKEENG
jgi:hypothetical protein